MKTIPGTSGDMRPMPIMIGWLLRGLGCLAVIACAAAPAAAQSGANQPGQLDREDAIKAAYLYHFGSYVQWPPETLGNNENPFVIGVVGVDPITALLTGITQTKKVGDHPIVVKRLATMAAYTPCHLLYVSTSAAPEEEAAAIEATAKAPVLLVGESPDFAERGGTVGFFIENNKVRFAINPESAGRQGLKISSKLLSLARIVDTP